MFERLLARIADALDAAGIPYMVIGGQAVLVHGEPRLTGDIDVTVDVRLDEVARLQSGIEDLGLDVLVDVATFTRDTHVVPCRDPATGIRVDFVLATSPYERGALARACGVLIGTRHVRFTSAEDLVIHKLLGGRPRDLDDARGILLKHPALDHVLIRRWLCEYGPALGKPLEELFQALLRDPHGE